MKKLIIALLCCIFVWAGGNVALASNYPNRPVTLIVPWAAGGAGSIAAQLFAAHAEKHLGQNILVVNRPGASGITGSTSVWNAPADGYTILHVRPGSHAINPAFQGDKMPYDWTKFTYLGMYELTPFVYVVRKDSPIMTMKDLEAAIRANPGKLRYSHSGPLTTNALGAQLFNFINDLPVNATIGVPFNSDGEAKIALLGGHVDYMGVPLGGVMDQILADTVRPLALITFEPIEGLENVPTVEEAGYPALMNIGGFTGLCAPPGTPKEVVDKWRTVFQEVGKNPEWIAATRRMGHIPAIKTPEELNAYIAEQIELYEKVFAALRKEQ